MKAIKMVEGIYRVGANIENGDMFEGMWPIPNGVSLNCYLVKGEKTALIDLVRDWDGAPLTIKEQLESIHVSFKKIDYLVLNHLEPDHTGWLRDFIYENPGIEIITTKKGAALAKAFSGLTDNIRVVVSGDTLDLGKGKEFVFYEIPNVHWPETMATFEKNSKILFSCDAFGSYGSIGSAVFDDELSQEDHEFFYKEALRYYANIVSTFSSFVLKAIDKLKDLDIKMIAPSHGIIWREDPGKVVSLYKDFASYMDGPAEAEITVIWGSMYGHTEQVLNSVVKGIRSENIPVHIHRVPDEDVSWALADAWKSTGLVFGMPTYEYKMFPPIVYALDVFGIKHVWNKKVFRFGSWGWSGGAQKDFEARTEKLRWDFIDPVEWNGYADEEVHKLAFGRGKELAILVKETASKKAD